MTLTAGTAGLVLLAALAHAVWNALVKGGPDRLVMQALVIGTPATVAACALPFLPLPDPAAWPYLGASAVVHTVYFATLIAAYRHGDLSLVYPIARGTAPMFTALGAWLFAAEALGPLEAAGICLLSGAIVSLALRPGDGTSLRGVAWALATSLTIVMYSLIDGLGGRVAGEVFAYIAWMFALSGVPLGVATLWLRRGRLKASFAPCLRTGVFGGLIGGAGYAIVIWAMSQAPVAHVVALRETSVLMAAAIGALAFREPFGRRRILAAGAVVVGAALMRV